MPNWCDNYLQITGSIPQDLVEKWELGTDPFNVGKERLLFDRVLPRPSDYFGDIETWNRKNWGCKWDCLLREFELFGDILTIEFYSPWCPPIEGVRTLSEQYPKLTFELRYLEPGESIRGADVFEAGERTECFKGSCLTEPLRCPECEDGLAYGEIDMFGEIGDYVCNTCDAIVEPFQTPCHNCQYYTGKGLSINNLDVLR